jgi:hypothetical protein
MAKKITSAVPTPTIQLCIRVTPELAKKTRAYAIKNQITLAKAVTDGLRALVEK